MIVQALNNAYLGDLMERIEIIKAVTKAGTSAVVEAQKVARVVEAQKGTSAAISKVVEVQKVARVVENIGELEIELAGVVPGTLVYEKVMRRIENAFNALPEGKEKLGAGKLLDKIRIRQITLLAAEFESARVTNFERADAIRSELYGLLDATESGSRLRDKILNWMAKNPRG